MSEIETGWLAAAELDAATINGLIAALGVEVFSSLKADFEADLRKQRVAYQDARTAGNDRLASESAHALRGAALNIGLSRLGALAGELENGDRADEARLDEVLESSLACLFAAG